MDRISHLYDDYKDIIDEFGKDRIQERFNDLYVACDEFISKCGFQESVKINDYILTHAIMDYFTDKTFSQNYANQFFQGYIL